MMTYLVSYTVLFVLLVAIAAAFVRVVVGPSLPDRIIALDLIGTLVVGMILVYCVKSGSALYVPAAIAMALLSFLGTVALALYIRKGGPP